jgi:hypothetical protein
VTWPPPFNKSDACPASGTPSRIKR